MAWGDDLALAEGEEGELAVEQRQPLQGRDADVRIGEGVAVAERGDFVPQDPCQVAAEGAAVEGPQDQEAGGLAPAHGERQGDRHRQDEGCEKQREVAEQQVDRHEAGNHQKGEEPDQPGDPRA